MFAGFTMKYMQYVNIAAYQFVELADFRTLRDPLLEYCHALGLKGTILLSPEGINLMLAGIRNRIEAIKTHLQEDHRLSALVFQESMSASLPFRRMQVKLKREIISFGRYDIHPHKFAGPRLSPQSLKQWLDQEHDFILLDTRNDYEVRLGTFNSSIHLGIRHFREFPSAATKLSPSIKHKPMVMFCTGGVRCEKASALLLKYGFTHVYQLAGGILSYFREYGAPHWQGECFVFDQRVGLTPDLQPTGTRLCPKCQHKLDNAGLAETKRGSNVCVNCGMNAKL